MSEIFEGMLGITGEMLVAIVPLAAVSIFAQIRTRGYDKDAVRETALGFLYLLVGVTLFLQGVTRGFFPTAKHIGATVARMGPHVLIPVGFFLGLAATVAEPAVRVLMVQVEEESTGAIKSKYLLYSLSLGVGIMVALGMARISFDIPIEHIVIPGYIIALLLIRTSDPTFVALAFDSGGAATGPMAVAFLSSLSVGASSAVNPTGALGEGFGMVALIALAPILSVMILGFIYSYRPGGSVTDEPGVRSDSHNN